jgi:chaperone modulatory protein CbpM
MPPSEESVASGIFEEYAVLSIRDLSRMCAVDEHHIVELVQEGVLDVVDPDHPEWRFTGAALRRARLALRLERDLQINLAGIALALELLEELEQLRRQVRHGI